MSGTAGRGDSRSEVERLAEEFLAKYRAGEWPRMADYIRKNPHLEREIREVFPPLLLMERVGSAGPPEPEKPPEALGPYRIERLLGTGGQGEVYLAEDTRLGRKVALKVLPRSADPTGRMLERFRREAAVAARLDHPGLCTVYEAGEEGGRPYIAMRFVDGESLAQWVEATRGSDGGGGAVPARGSRAPADVRSRDGVMRLVEIVEKAARALHAAHGAGLIHRDIKPGNIMVTAAGEPVLLDFGLAREEEDAKALTLTGTLMGTPAYMSPEQIAAQRIPLDRRTDVYSLGVTLYECLTLRLPFEAPTRDQLYHRILVAEPEDPRRLNSSIPRDLRVVLETALEKDRDRRYQTAADFAEDLRRVRANEPILARPAGPALRLRRWSQRNPATAASVAVAFLALGAGLGVSLGLLAETRRERDAKETALLRARAEGDAKEAARRNAETERDAKVAALLDREAALAEARGERDAKAKALGRAEGLGLAARSLAVLPEEPGLALALALEAARRAPGIHANEAVLAALGRNPEARRFDGPAEAGSFAFFLPDRTGLAVVQSGACRVIDLATGEDRGRSPLARAEAVIRSADGSRAVLANRGTLVAPRVLDPADPAQGVDLEPTGDPEIVAPVFSDDGALLAAAGMAGERQDAPGSLLLWDARTGKLVSRIEAVAGPVAVAADGSAVLASGMAALCLWRPGQGIVELPFAGAFRPTAEDQQLLAGWFEGSRPRIALSVREEGAWSVRFLDPETKEETQRLPDAGPYVRAWFDPGRTRMLAMRGNGDCEVWDLATEAKVAACRNRTEDGSPAPEDTLSRGREFLQWGHLPVPSPDLRRVLLPFRGSSRAVVWDAAEGVPLVDLVGHQGSILGAEFSQEGRHVATWGADGTVRLWDLDPGTPRRLRAPPGGVSAVAFDPTGTRVAGVCRGEDLLRIWDARDGRVIHSLGNVRGSGVRWAVFSPDGRYLLGSFLGREPAAFVLQVWDAATGAEVGVLEGHRDNVWAVAFSPDGGRLATASRDGARVWDLATRREVARLATDSVGALQFSPDGKRLLTASWDGTARVWDPGTGNRLLEVPVSGSPIPAAAWTPDGTRFVTGSFDGTARVWEATTGKALLRLEGHAKVAGLDPAIWDLAVSPDGGRLVTASWDGTARVWDLATGRCVHVLDPGQGMLYRGTFSPDGSRILTATEDGNAYLWDADTGEPLVRYGKRRSMWLTGARMLYWSRPLGEFRPDGKSVVLPCEGEDPRIWPTDPVAAARERGPRPLTAEERERYVAPLGQDYPLRRAARQTVLPLLSRLLLVEDVVAALEKDPGLDPAAKAAALALAREQREDPMALNNAAWEIARIPSMDDGLRRRLGVALGEPIPAGFRGPTAEERGKALRWAEAAVRLAPGDGNLLNTLGVAQYRTGRFAEAAETLRRSDDLNGGHQPADVAFLAMALLREGKGEEARTALERLRAVVREPGNARNQESRFLLVEAEAAFAAGE